MINLLFAAAVATAPPLPPQAPPQTVTITLSVADLNELGKGLDLLPRGESEPVFERLYAAAQAALRAQQQPPKPAPSAGHE